MMRAMKNRMLALFFASVAALTVCGAESMAADVRPSPSADTSNGGAAPVLATAPVMTPSRGTQVGFVDSAGFPVYVFDLDLSKPGTSQCNAACATHWPAIPAPAIGTLSAPWGTIVRSDGTNQLTYAGRPLYAYAGDRTSKQRAKGDLENAQGGIWRLAQSQTTNAPAKTP
jgi:predicted lipoprotein with Yx(FWY)xxD motif